MSDISTHNQDRDDRHIRLAQQLGIDPDIAREKFTNARVLVAIDAATGASKVGNLMAKASMNLIARFCPRVDVYAPENVALADALVSLGADLEDRSGSEFRAVDTVAEADYKTALVIGSLPLTWKCITEVNASGWLAAVSSNGHCPPLPSGPAGIGSLIAAALGAAQVFIRLLKPRGDAARLSSPAVFSAWDFSRYEQAPWPAEVGPDIPPYSLPRTLLAGAGAVGQAVAYTLREFPPVSGSLWVIDQKRLSTTNRNRCVFANAQHFTGNRPPFKSELLRDEMRSALPDLQVFASTKPLKESLQYQPAWGGSEAEIVIGTVDNYEAREELQHLWPRLLLEGSTGDAEIQALRWQDATDVGCTLCYHQDPRLLMESDIAERLAALSGLSTELIRTAQRDADMLLLAADAEAAPPEQRVLLQPYVGSTICAVLSDIEHKSLLSDPPPEPSVSFASFFAGVLAASEVIKYSASLGHTLDSQLQYNMLFPVRSATLTHLTPLPTCVCARRRRTLARRRKHSK